jgi:hypothetical protein
MRAICAVLTFAVLLIGSWSIALAEEDNGIGDPNNPNDDNSCYAGGVWEGKCDSEWTWNAGWYLHRALNRELTCDEVPLEYRSACLAHFPLHESSAGGEVKEEEPPPPPL